MVTASIGVAVRKAVTDGLAAHFATLSDYNGDVAAEREVVVTFGYPFGQVYNDLVFTGRSRGDTPPAALRSGRNTRNESGTFDLTVMSRFVGGDPYDAEARAEDIGGVAEDWLADRKSAELGVTGLLSLIVTGWAADYAQVDGGISALRTYTIRWTARLE